MVKLILLLLHFLPSLDQWIAQSFGYWIGLIPRSFSHFILPMIWEKSPSKAIKTPFQVKNLKSTLIWSVGGVLAAATALTTTYLLLKNQLDPEQIREGVNAFYPVTIPMYLAVSVMISFVNPLMEEFYWRGFLYRKFREHGGGIWVGLLFAVHHYVIFRSWFEPIPLSIALAGLAIVGVGFNWLYNRTDNLWPCLATHCAADITIMTIGYTILF